MLASDLTGKFLIQTATGPALFSGTGCLGVFVGSRVSFATSPALCVTNQITPPGSQTACAVTCDGAGYPGTVVSSDYSTFVIGTVFGNKTFKAESICLVNAADMVVLASTPAACATNAFADVRSGQFCAVFCN